MKVAIIIPAYNEGSVIASVVNGVKDALAKEKYLAEIIVVDDGSMDDTANNARAAGATVIRHILNTGSGGATATGLDYARKNDFTITATLDGDGQHDPEDLVKGIRLIQTNDTDLMIGSRLIDTNGMSRLKVLGNRGLSVITFLLFGINVTDSQSGMRIFSQNGLHHIKWRTNGYEFCSEMLWRARQKGMKIAEYPIRAIYTDYSKAKGQNNWNSVHIIKSLLSRRIREIFGE